MDQGPDQEVDIHQGLESTLLMLRHRLKQGITVKLDFDRTLPKICARGSELNQVWTNLIDNAIDAMEGKGELRIRTARELDRLLVEIGDNGPGIPPEVQAHIFEPFFTTKGVGTRHRAGSRNRAPHRAGAFRRDHGPIRSRRHPFSDSPAARAASGATS
jgi:signal transduction histidine kinase